MGSFAVPLDRPSNDAVLLLVDLQLAIGHADWGQRNNLDAEAVVAALLAHWRERNWPVWHIRHDSTEPQSHYFPGQPLHAFLPEALPQDDEPVIAKTVNNAFIGTELEARLRAAGHSELVVAGVVTNNSVEATVRMAGNLGFTTWLVEEACFAFDQRDLSGRIWPAQDVHALSLANMDREYCTVISSKVLLG